MAQQSGAGAQAPAAQRTQRVATAATADDHPAPGGNATAAAIVLALAAVLFAAFVDLSADVFKPRVPTVDVLAGLFVGAFFVDRVLTFMPPLFVRKPAAERASDLAILRMGFGAAIGAIFVSLTDLRAVETLTNSGDISESADRGIAVLAIAGGVTGLAQLLDGLKPKDKTSDTPDAAAATPAAVAEGTLRMAKATPENTPPPDAPQLPPTSRAYLIGLAGLVIGGLIALSALSDDTDGGAVLLGTEEGGGDVVVRLGLVILAAAIVEQVVEKFFATHFTGPDKPLIAGAIAVVGGVAAARILDLYLLHNLGFFGSAPGTATDITNLINNGPGAERWFDTFVTGLVIASGTKAVHDLGSRLRKAKPGGAATTG